MSFTLKDGTTGTGRNVFLDDVSLTPVPSGQVGTLVSSLIASGSGSGPNKVSDADPGAKTGIAVTGVSDALGGMWFYSTNNGATWTAFPSVSATNVLMLAADASTRVYFSPNGSSPPSKLANSSRGRLR